MSNMAAGGCAGMRAERLRPSTFENPPCRAAMADTPSPEIATKPAPLSGNDRRLAGNAQQILAQDRRLLFGHQYPEQVGIVRLCRFRRLHAFQPEHDAVARVMMVPADQCPETLHHPASPPPSSRGRCRRRDRGFYQSGGKMSSNGRKGGQSAVPAKTPFLHCPAMVHPVR